MPAAGQRAAPGGRRGWVAERAAGRPAGRAAGRAAGHAEKAAGHLVKSGWPGGRPDPAKRLARPGRAAGWAAGRPPGPHSLTGRHSVCGLRGHLEIGLPIFSPIFLPGSCEKHSRKSPTPQREEAAEGQGNARGLTYPPDPVYWGWVCLAEGGGTNTHSGKTQGWHHAREPATTRMPPRSPGHWRSRRPWRPTASVRSSSACGGKAGCAT